MNFLCDERIQALSAQAESFLNRLREVFTRYPMALDEHGRAPADPAQLRNLTYPHRPDIRHTYVARWFAEIEAASLVTMFETEAQGRWFELRAGVASGAELANAGQSPQRSVPFASSKAVGERVIHIDGVGPPIKADEIAVVAAAASDSLDLITRLRPFFPRHDVAAAFKRFVAHREKRKLALTNEAFARWMLKEEVPIVKATAKPPRPEVGGQRSEIRLMEDQPDLFDELAHRKFLAEVESRKMRRTGGVAHTETLSFNRGAGLQPAPKMT